MIRLNLLPPERKQALRQRATVLRWRKVISLVVIFVLVGNGLAVAADQWLVRKQSSAQQSLEQLQRQSANSEIGTITNQIRTLNNTITPLATALPTNRDWAGDIATALNLLPANVTLEQLTLNLAGDISYSGTAQTRADFISLDTLLKQEPHLKNVQTDSQASRREALPFHYTATFQTPPAS